MTLPAASGISTFAPIFNRDLRLERYPDATTFLAAVGDFLLQDEARHHLMLGIAYARARADDHGDDGQYYAAVFGPDGAVLAALRTDQQNLVLSRCMDPDAMRLLAKDAVSSFALLPGVNATGDGEGNVFISRWMQARPGTACRLARQEQIYDLTEVTMPSLPPGAFRKATPEDRDVLVEWLDLFQQEALGIRDRTFVELTVDRRIGAPGELEGTYLWVDGEPRAMAMASRPTPHGLCVRGVWTPTEHRRKGYASAVVSTLCARILEQGFEHCYLYADRANEASNRIYQDMGFTPVCHAQHWVFDR